MAPGLNKIVLKPCRVPEPHHPCDPPAPCDICISEEAQCPQPVLCLEKLKNPYHPFQTKCKTGASIGVERCKKKDPPHPCDPPLPCIPGRPRKEPCPDPALCKERVKNLESAFIRCHPDPEDFISRTICDDLTTMKTPVPVCPKVPCPQRELLDPFGQYDKLKAEKEEEKRDTSKDYLYSKELCKNLDLMKQKVVECFKKPCTQRPLLDPFEDEAERRKKEKMDKVDDPCEYKKKH